MKKYIMFVDWDNQYCQKESNTQCNLQIQCNPYQKNFRIFIKAQKTPNSQSNLEKKHGAGKIRLPDFTLYDKVTIIRTVQYWTKKYKYR